MILVSILIYQLKVIKMECKEEQVISEIIHVMLMRLNFLKYKK